MNKQFFATFSGWLLVLTFFLIIIGGATRVFDAGMACPDWPACYGLLIPFPESKVIGGYIVAGVHYEWWQVLLEWGHRFLAMVVGLGSLALFVMALKLKKTAPLLWKVSLVSLLLLLIQVKLGAVTVWLSNIHWTVAVHLGNAMLFFASLVVLRRLAALPETVEVFVINIRPQAAVWGFAVLVWLTMLFGAMVSSAHAGGVCGGLFDCDGKWLPSEDWEQMLHMKHRFLALLTLLWSLMLVMTSRVWEKSLRHSTWVLHVMVIIQAGWGISTLYSFTYAPWSYYLLSVVHLAWGTLIFMAAVGTIMTLYVGSQGRFHAFSAPPLEPRKPAKKRSRNTK